MDLSGIVFSKNETKLMYTIIKQIFLKIYQCVLQSSLRLCLSTNEQNTDHGNQGANDMNYGSRPAAARA